MLRFAFEFLNNNYILAFGCIRRQEALKAHQTDILLYFTIEYASCCTTK